MREKINMSKSIVISERDNIAAVMENGKVMEFFINRGDMLLGDVYLATVENILPSIDAAFVNVGGDRMGFLHASDVPGKGALKDRLKPKQQLVVQIVKEPTGHKGPRVTTALSLPGRFLVLMPEEKGINVSRKIVSPKERARLKSIVSLMKPAGVGVIIRTEAENQAETEIQEDLELLLEKWQNIVTAADTVTAPNLLCRDQDLLYKVIREACTEDVKDIILDTSFALHRTNQLLQAWNINNITTSVHKGSDSVLVAKGIDKEIKTALQTKVTMPSGGYLFIQTTEALTVIDVNSGKFTSSATQNETITKTNLEAVQETARQLKLRNIGGMIIIDFIDMENRIDQLAVLEALEMALEPDKSKPQVGQLSDLGLVELTRHRQGQSLHEIFTKKCPACAGTGSLLEDLNFMAPPQDATDFRGKPQQSKQLKMAPKVMKPVISTGPKPQAATEERPAKQEIQQRQPQQQQQRQKDQQPQIAEVKPVRIKEDDVKTFISSKGYAPSLSKVIYLASVPPTTAKNNFAGYYRPNVFTLVQMLQLKESEPVQQETAPAEQAAVEASEPAVAEGPTTETEKQEPSEPAVSEEKHEEQAEEPAQEIKAESEETKSAEDEEKAEPVKAAKKPVRRGRKPKTETAARKPTRRTTTKAAEKTNEE